MKSPYVEKFHLVKIVAPLVGAWIEMTGRSKSGIPGTVAPLVGAWIEIAIFARTAEFG